MMRITACSDVSWFPASWFSAKVESGAMARGETGHEGCSDLGEPKAGTGGQPEISSGQKVGASRTLCGRSPLLLA